MAEKSNRADADRMLGAYRDNESVLKAFLRRFTNNSHDVEDICQETVLRALEAVRSREILEPGPFLFGVARNIVRNNFAKKSRNLIDFVTDFSPDEYVSETPSPEQALDEQQRLLLFGEALASLPAQCKQVFVLKKVHGHSHKEIARMLHISVSTVEKHAAMGLKRCSDFVTRQAGRDARAAQMAVVVHPAGGARMREGRDST
jgi:RNA polymerase sigma-70 factor (ECF subfamily)